MNISIKAKAGTFAENKDIARDVRLNKIMPALAKGQKVTLDFAEVTGATQSFVHALISEAIRQYGDEVFDKMYFKNCTENVREIINIVAEYMQES
jgi:hypothetical protein